MTPDEFKAWRKAMGWSQAEMADALGLSRGSIENYERGSRREDGRPVEIPGVVVAAMFVQEHIAREERQLAFLEGLGGEGIYRQTAEQPERHDITVEVTERQRERVASLHQLLGTLTNKKPAE